jgi:ATP-binding protein involved in chromosome partitioning
MNLATTVQQLLSITCDDVLHLTATEMQLTSSVTIQGQHIALVLTAGIPIATLEQHLKPALQTAFNRALPHHTIDITLLSQIQSHETQLVGKRLRNIKNAIAIGSGKGGVGKSTVTTNLAVTLARLGARVGILDADIYGPSIPTMLGTHTPVVFENERYLPVQAHGVYAMSIGYLTKEHNSTLIWRGPMLAKSLLQMLDMTAWPELDYLFIDLPPGTGDIQLSLVQKIPLTGAIVVTTPQHVATQDADKALNLFHRTHIPVLGVIENMAAHQCSACGHVEALFGAGGGEQLCAKHHCPYLGQLPLDAQISQSGDAGTPNALAETWEKIALTAMLKLTKRPGE